MLNISISTTAYYSLRLHPETIYVKEVIKLNSEVLKQGQYCVDSQICCHLVRMRGALKKCTSLSGGWGRCPSSLRKRKFILRKKQLKVLKCKNV